MTLAGGFLLQAPLPCLEDGTITCPPPRVVGGRYPWEGLSSWLGVEGKLTYAAKCHSSVLMCFQYYDENKWVRKPSGEGTRREEEKQESEETGKRRESLVRREEAAEAKQPERATWESGRIVHFCAG